MVNLDVSPEEAAYWRRTPHTFAPAHWGRAYCALCLDPRRRVVHVRREDLPWGDPRKIAGYQQHTGNWSQTVFRVEAWDGDAPDEHGAACSYGFDHRTGSAGMTREQADDYARHLKMHGDGQGRRYAHHAVVEYRHTSVCVTLVHPVTEEN